MSKARDLSNFISVATVDATEMGANSVTTTALADLNVTHAKLHTDMNLSSKTLTLGNNQISGNAIDGGVISNFASTGIDDNSSSTALIINSSGEVGIGETAPLGKLHVKNGDSGATADVGADELVVENNTHAGITILSGQSYNGSIYFGDAGVNYDGFITYGQGTRSMGFGSAAGTRMTLNSSGNVGIGTANPLDRLHIYGNEANGTMGIVLQDDGWGAPNGQYKLTVRNSDGAFVIRKNTSGNFDFATADDHLVLTSGGGEGRFGVNTPSPVANLEVTGTFKNNQYLKVPLSVVWSHGTSNQTAKISLGTSQFWGTIKVTVTAEYSHGNASGVYSKIYSCGLNPSGVIFTNSSQIAENGGETSKHFQLENYMSWDSTNNEWYLAIHHLEGSGNTSNILLEAWGASNVYANNLLNAYTSSVTTDSNITFKRPEYSSYTISQVQAVGSENNYVHDGLQLLFDAHHGFINGQAPYCLITGTTATLTGTASTAKQNVGGVNCLEISDDGSVQWPGKVQGTPRTYEIWVYHKDANPNTRNWESYFDDANTESVLFGKQGNTNIVSVYTAGVNATVARGQKWFQVAYTIDDTSKNYSVRMFFNGELVDQGYNALNRNLSAAGGTLLMGGDAGSECLNGYIALARVYNRALSNEELRQNFDNNRERFGI